MIATSTGLDVARLLLDLLIVLVAAKAAAELAELLRIPAVLGEILAGIAVGPSVLGLVELSGERNVSFTLLAEIGVLLLLVQVGMEMDVTELSRVGRTALSVAVIGVAAPFAGGYGVAVLAGLDGDVAIFLGAALTATSVGITARVLGDLRALATVEARVVLGAAVADDVLGLVILTVVVKMVTDGSVGASTIASTLGIAALFLVGAGVLAVLAVPPLLDAVHRRASSPATVSVVALGVVIGFAELADSARLAFIIGAFISGLGLGRSRHHERIGRDLGAVGHLFIPVFFAQIGINADLAAMFSPSVLGLAVGLTCVAIVGKLSSALGVTGGRADRVLVGVGMIPRGEVGLIFASIGRSTGVLDADQYGALLLVVLVTTVLTPPLLRWRLGRAPEATRTESTPEPPGGWLTVSQGVVHLDGVPPVEATVSLALQAALLTGSARPSDGLLDWFGRQRTANLDWHRDDTDALLRVMAAGNARSWRFLEVTGVLERALPDVAAAMTRRRADIGDLDPASALSFPVVERRRQLAHRFGVPEDTLVLASLCADVCGDDVDGGVRRLAQRLVSDEEAERIVHLVEDARLLRSGAHDPHAFDDVQILQLATHLADVNHARSAHQLALALDPLPTWQRQALEERMRLVEEALRHPELTGSGAANLAAARRAAAERLLEDPMAVERLQHASTGYLLSHQPEELARHARLVEPLPRSGSVRVSVTAGPLPEHWTVDVACRDATALLARITGALGRAGLDIANAHIATWPDGAVLDSFVVRSEVRPSARELADRIERSLGGRLRLEPRADVTVRIDNETLPWHTLVHVTGADRPGVLHAVAAALSACNVVVHSARVDTNNGEVNDRFSVTDRVGRKLDGRTSLLVAATINSGTRPRRSRTRHRHVLETIGRSSGNNTSVR